MSEKQTSLATRADAALLENVVVGGDLSKLTPAQRVSHYAAVCESLRLNPLTKPFQYITLNGRLVLYATRDCTDQLRNRDSISTSVAETQTVGDLHIVRARASRPDGRTDEDLGAVNIAGLKGDALANAMMKAMTKAKRRVTLSICGLGWLDETEVETVPDARLVQIDMDTGEVALTTTPSGPACEECGTILESEHYTLAGKRMTRDEYITKSKAKYRRVLCLSCMEVAMNALKETATKTMQEAKADEEDAKIAAGFHRGDHNA